MMALEALLTVLVLTRPIGKEVVFFLKIIMINIIMSEIERFEDALNICEINCPEYFTNIDNNVFCYIYNENKQDNIRISVVKYYYLIYQINLF